MTKTERKGFQFRRSEAENGDYLHELVDTSTGDAIESETSRSPIASPVIRATQARLNTKFVLDLGGVI